MEAPSGGGIELAVVQRFVDVALDALADAREEIDALNVYPVPDGWQVVGEVRAGSGVTVDGLEYDGPTGWTHF